MMEKLMSYITYFMAVVGVVSVIYQFGFKMSKDTSRIDRTEEIITQMTSKEIRDEAFKDSVIVFSGRMEDKLDFLKEQFVISMALLNALRTSYVNYLRSDSSLKRSEFYNYMEGIEFNFRSRELENAVDTSSYKILIRKANVKGF